MMKQFIKVFHLRVGDSISILFRYLVLCNSSIAFCATSFMRLFACFAARLTSATTASASVLALTFISSSCFVCATFRFLANSSHYLRFTASRCSRLSVSCWTCCLSTRRAVSSLEMGTNAAAAFEVKGMGEVIVAKRAVSSLEMGTNAAATFEVKGMGEVIVAKRETVKPKLLSCLIFHGAYFEPRNFAQLPIGYTSSSVAPMFLGT